ncbi:hypothetical protein TWF281_010909 [Arthrobotrys megalospora]
MNAFIGSPIRLATVHDVPRIGLVAAAGFQYSNFWDWERPYADKYPEDTLKSYCLSFKNLILNPCSAVWVAEDTYDEKEAHGPRHSLIESAYSQISLDAPKDQKVIVGVTAWVFPSDSDHCGKFKPDNPNNEAPGRGFRGRDTNSKHMDMVDEAAEEATKKYFPGCPELSMTVVHPSYWRRGHGSSMVKWGMDLAKENNETLGTISSTMGNALCEALGWSREDTIHLEGDDEAPDGLTFNVNTYNKNKD